MSGYIKIITTKSNIAFPIRRLFSSNKKNNKYFIAKYKADIIIKNIQVIIKLCTTKNLPYFFKRKLKISNIKDDRPKIFTSIASIIKPIKNVRMNGKYWNLYIDQKKIAIISIPLILKLEKLSINSKIILKKGVIFLKRFFIAKYS